MMTNVPKLLKNTYVAYTNKVKRKLENLCVHIAANLSPSKNGQYTTQLLKEGMHINKPYLIDFESTPA